MIHQIADENGTLKHIILSVMDSDETNAQLDSTVITLPQGTFRINSHGELESTGSDGSNGDSTFSLTTLSQQAYFANYDGCPVAYNATSSTQLEADNIDSTTAAAMQPMMTDATEATTINNIDDRTTIQHSKQQEHVNSKSAVTGSGDKNKSIKGRESSNKENFVTGNHNRQVSVASISNLSQTTPVVESLINSSEQAPKEEISTSLAVTPSTASEAEQMVVPTSISDTPYTTNHHQVMPTNEVDIMNGAMAPPILSTVDGQLYSYPPCCCCCYCDPQEATPAAGSRGTTASGGSQGHSQQQHQEQPQQHQNQSGHQPPLMMTGLTGQHQQDVIVGPTDSHSSNHNTSHGSGKMSSRGSANSLANGVMAYGPPLIGPPMQNNFGLPINVVGPHGPQIIQPIATNSQNGMQTIQGPGLGLPSEQQPQQQQQQPSGKVHSGKGSRGPSNSGYKQHKINSIGSNNHLDRQQQNYNTNHYNSASYNNIVSGHHHQQQTQQNPYHNHHHNHHHHHSQTSDQSSSFVKSQALLPNQMMSGGNYSPVYSNYNHAPASLATIVSSNKVGQQTSPYVRAPPENDSYMQPQQRGSREPLSYSSHVSNNYSSPNVRSNGKQQQQHNESKRQNLGDKSSLTNQHNSNTGRYNSSANVKISANNHLLNSNPQPTSVNSSHHQADSVSPMRGRMKASNSTQYHHQSNGVRTSNFYNQVQHDSKDNSMIQVHTTTNNIFQQHARDSGIPVNHHVNHIKTKTVYPHGQDQHAASAKSKQHINANISPYYQPPAQGAPQNKGAWQCNQQHKSTSNNGLGSTHDNEGANFRHLVGQKPNPPSEPQTNKQPEEKVSIEEFDNVEAGGLPSFALSASNDRHSSASAKSNGVASKNQDDLDSRSSRGKQKKCQNNPAIKNSPSSEFHSGDRLKQVPASNEAAHKSDLISNEISPPNDQDEKSDQIDKTLKLNVTRSDSLSRPAKDNSSTKQQQAQGKNGNQKRIREKSSSQQPVTGKPKDTSQQPTVDNNNGSRHSQELKSNNLLDPSQSDSTIGLKRSSELTSIDSKRRNSNGDSSSPVKALSTSRQLSDDQLRSLELNSDERIELQQRKQKNKHNTNQQAATHRQGQIKNESSPARATTTTKKNSKSSQSSSALKTEGSQAGLESLVTEELDNDIVLKVSRADSPVASVELKACQHQPPSLNISMRTSYSENNIQSLDTFNSSVKSTQTTPQKLPLATNLTNNEPITIAKSGGSSSDLGGKKNHGGGDKKRGSSARTDHKVKLTSMPQLRLLNLNCTSVTSSSVQLRWSYIPNLAEKYGIQPHSSGSKNFALMDHFVIESSGTKNVETNALISPKIVYQGCSFTCRVNHLSSEKIYHFKVRRTALVTANNKGESQPTNETGNSEHLVVSEILSVTLPSVQQYQQQLNANQQQQQSLSNKKSSSSGSKSSSNSLIDHHQATASSSPGIHHESGSIATSVSFGTLSAYRGNSSSHHSNSNNGKTLLPSIKFSSLFRQCRTKFVTMLGRLVQNSLSSYSDTKFAGLLLILFTIFAMLLAIFIHLYIVAPVSE